MRKPTSILETQLDEARQALVADWLLSGIPYHRAGQMVQEQFGLKVSAAQFSRFWESVCAPQLLRRRARAVETANAVAVEAEKQPGRFDVATIDALKQKAFEMTISPQADPRDVKSLFTLVLKSRDQEIDAQQLKLDRERFEFLKTKAEQAQQAEEVVIGAGSAEEKQQKLRAIFGLQ